MRIWLALAGIAGFTGVAAGAFGAHALEGLITPDRLSTFETGVLYHLLHAPALALLTALPGLSPGLRRLAGSAFAIGIAIFSGSLYLLVLTDTPWLGAVTPIGGIAFLVGWATLFLAAVTRGRNREGPAP